MSQYFLPPIEKQSQPLRAGAMVGRVNLGLRKSSIPEIWHRSAGRGVLVTLLGTGFPRHRDLPTPAFTNNFTNSMTGFDRNSNQTLCAGIVSAKNHEFGVVGLAHKAALAHIKVVGDNGLARTSWVERGLQQATKQWRARKRDHLGCVIGLSLRGGFDEDLEQAIAEAADAGIIVVASATDDAAGQVRCSDDSCPGASRFAIGVSQHRHIEPVEKWNVAPPEADLYFSGENFLSTVDSHQYQIVSGAPMATAAVAGLAACILSSRPRDDSIRNVDGMRSFLRDHFEASALGGPRASERLAVPS